MTAPHRPVLRATIGRLAITGAATLATVFAVAPVALADDATTIDPTESSAPSTETTVEVTPGESSAPDQPTAEAPSTDAPDAGTPAPVEATDEAPTKIAAADEIVIEPDFGTQKFRVGVQIDDGSVVPEGTTTVGSTFRITITDEDGEVVGEPVTCTTTEENLDEETGQSFCPGDLGPIGLSRAAEAPPEITEDDEFVFATAEQQFLLGPGETATITQVGAADGLDASDDTVTIEPCETDEDSLEDLGSPFPDGPLCTPADFDNTPVKITKVVFNNAAAQTDTRGDGAENGDTENADALLPDTGGADASLLGYAALLLAGGGWLTVRGRRRADASTD